jgi:hypothetical protein
LGAGFAAARRETLNAGLGLNLVIFPMKATWNPLPPFGFLTIFPEEERMAKTRSASAHPGFHDAPVEDEQPLTLLRRLAVEIEDSITQSRAVILSTRDAIELLERLEGRQFSN